MKRLPTICLLLCALSGMAQDHSSDPSRLAKDLVANCRTEKEKVQAIFNWITENISYHRPLALSGKPGRKIAAQPCSPDVDEESIELPSLDDRVARKVLREKMAVCEGYARLFQSLCNHAGIKSQIITGYARTRMLAADNRFRSNHTWNAVFIDSSWHLLDATWASGFIAWPSGDFVRQYDPYYFFSDPAGFVRHHYPDDLRWTLLENPPAIPEFRKTPFLQKSFHKYGILSHYPERGLIEATLGDTIRLQLVTRDAQKNTRVLPDSLWEEASLMQSPAIAYAHPVATDGNNIYYHLPVHSTQLKWVYVMYNQDAVLRYRVDVRMHRAPHTSR